tara:strand:+ start:78 stop:599 length:522 start_codon:yes stop_codon:yes gene_type:complete
MEKSAIISDCGLYRYRLDREWEGKTNHKVMFLMLNPSTANSDINDTTTTRCINYAKKWGYGGLIIGNIYPYRTKSPKELMAWKIFGEKYSIFKRNQQHLEEMADEAHVIILAWGAHYKGEFPMYLGCPYGYKMFYLELCKDKLTPKHPLGLSKKIKYYSFYDLQTKYENNWII